MEKGPTLWVRGRESERDPGAGLRERRCEGPELCQGQAEQERWLMSGTGDWRLETGDWRLDWRLLQDSSELRL